MCRIFSRAAAGVLSRTAALLRLTTALPPIAARFSLIAAALVPMAAAFALVTAATSLAAQQAPDNFRWVDFHSQKDQSEVAWVTRSLAVEDWTAIREIAVEYDAALVVTTKRATPESAANADTFSMWSASLTTHAVTPLVTGVNLRWLDWMRFADGAPYELAIVYDSCRECAANTYFTALRYDLKRHGWTARWINGGQGVPLWSANKPAGAEWTQAYAAFAEPNGREFVATWSHFDYANKKPSDDVVYRYDVDPVSGLERGLPLLGKDADAMELRICQAQGGVADLARGQDSALCQRMTKPAEDRRPVTTPPANNRGQSAERRVR